MRTLKYRVDGLTLGAPIGTSSDKTVKELEEAVNSTQDKLKLLEVRAVSEVVDVAGVHLESIKDAKA